MVTTIVFLSKYSRDQVSQRMIFIGKFPALAPQLSVEEGDTRCNKGKNMLLLCSQQLRKDSGTFRMMMGS